MRNAGDRRKTAKKALSKFRKLHYLQRQHRFARFRQHRLRLAQ